MKRNLLAGLLLVVGMPLAAFAADSNHAKKTPVVASAGTSNAKSDADAAAKNTKKKGKRAKAKTQKATKDTADKATGAK